MKNIYKIIIGSLVVFPLLVFATPVSVDRLTNDHIEPLIKTDYIKSPYFNATSTTASSTFANGINLTGGCYSSGGVCIGGSGTVNSGTANHVAYYGSSGTTVSSASNLFWNDATQFLGLGATNSGLQNNGGQVGLWAGGNNPLYVTGSNNVNMGNAANIVLPAGKTIDGAGNAQFAGISASGLLSATALGDNFISARLGVGSSTPFATLSVSTTTQNSGKLPLFSVASTTNATLFTVLGNGNVGVGTTTPGTLFSVAGNMNLTGKLIDSLNSAGTNGMVLQTTGNATKWVATSTLGYPWVQTGNSIAYSSGSLITVPDVTGTISSSQVVGGNYTAVGNTYEVDVYGYKLVNGQKIFSTTPLAGTFTDDNLGGSYYIAWSWTALAGVDGYRVYGQPDLTSANTPVFYIDTATNSLNQGLGESWIFQGTIPITNVLPKSTYNDIITANGKLDNSVGYLVTPNIISNSGDLTLQENNDLFGSTLISLGNRGGLNGLMVQNLGIDLTDVVMTPQSGVQATMRWEHRLGSVDPLNDGWGEYQIFVAGSSAFPTIPISTTGSTQVIQLGFNHSYLNTPTTVEARSSGVGFDVQSFGFGSTLFSVSGSGAVSAGSNVLNDGSNNANIAGSLTSGSLLSSSLSINGNGTIDVSGNGYFAGKVGIATSTPTSQLSVQGPSQQSGLLPLFTVASSTKSTLMTVLGNGNVGIGTTTPWAKFSINPIAGDGSIPSFAIGSSTRPILVVDNSGNTSLGTTTPLSRLDVVPQSGANKPAGYFSDGLFKPTNLQIGGFNSVLTLGIKDGNNDYQLGYLSPATGKIANYQANGNSLEFDHYSSADVSQGANYLMSYGGFAFGPPFGGSNLLGQYQLSSSKLAIGSISSYTTAASNPTPIATFDITNSRLGIATTTPDSTLDVNGTVRFEGASTVVTSSISGAIIGLGCDSVDTTVSGGLSSTTAFVTTPQSYPGDGLNWFSYLLNATTIRTKICSDVTVTPAASTYVVKIIK